MRLVPISRLVALPLLLVATSAGLTSPASAEEAAAAKPAAQKASERPAATIADMGWLEGSWSGTGIGGHPAGETFSFAGEGQMVGHFWQLAEDGTTQFYEIITVVPDGDSLTMRLKHFNADLTGWEEKGGEHALEFPLKERSATRWVFGPVTFSMPEEDRLDVSVSMKPSGGSPSSLEFSYTRDIPD